MPAAATSILGLPGVPGLPGLPGVPGLPGLPTGLPFGLNPLQPDAVVAMAEGLCQHVWADGAQLFMDVSARFFLTTKNFDPGGGPFTRNHALVGMYGVTAGIARWAVTLILLYTSARAIFEHGFRPRYTLKLVLPRAMVAAALIQFGLTVVQAAVDLNNSLTRAVWMGRIDSASALSGWAIFTRTTPGGNLLLAFLFAVVGVLLMLIALSSVARNVLLLILTAALPLVAVGFVLPEARGLVDAWRRLFLSTVFCQVAQVMTLRLAMILTLDRGSGFVDAVHGLVAFYLVLRMPSALHAASKAESKVLSFAHHLEHTATKALQGSATPARTSRVRAHPAA